VYERAMLSLDYSGEILWGRRSVFRLDDKPLIVAEIFLPAIRQLAVSLPK
jgi:chorismate--pyruvate lyase